MRIRGKRTFSLFSAASAIVVFVTTLVTGLHGIYSYHVKKEAAEKSILEETHGIMRSLQDALPPFLEAYAVQEYKNLLDSALESDVLSAVIIDDRIMGALTGSPVFLGGAYKTDRETNARFSQTEPLTTFPTDDCFHKETEQIINKNEEVLGTLTLCSSYSDLRHDLKLLVRNQVVDTGLISLALLATILYLLHRAIALPIQNISDSLSTASSSDLSSLKIRTSHLREVASLGEVVTQMVERINAAQNQLEATNEQISKSEERYRRLVEQTKDSVFIYSHDVDGVFNYVSPSVEAVLGYQVEDFMVHYQDLLTDNPINQDAIKYTALSIEGKTQPAYEVAARHKNGTEHFLRLSEAPVKTVDGQVTAIEGIAIDITAQKSLEDAIRKQEALYRQMFDNNTAIKLLIEPETGNIIHGNEAACQFYGYDQAQFEAMNIEEINTLPLDEIQKEMAQAKDESRHFFRFKHRTSTGDVKDVEVHTGPVHLDEKTYLYSVITDVTERNRYEAELMRTSSKLVEEEMRLSGILETTPNGIVELDADGNVLFANDEAGRILKQDAKSWIGQNFHDLCHHSHKDGTPYPKQDCQMLQAFGQAQPATISDEVLWTKDGEAIPVEYTANGKRDGDRIVGGIIAFRNISDRLAVQKQIEDQNNHLNAIIWGTQAGTWRWNVQTGEAEFNEIWAGIIGYKLEELEPISIETWLAFAHPDDLIVSNQLMEDHFAGKTQAYDCECRMKHKAGHWVWVHARGRVLEWTEDGKPLFMAGTHMEITARKNAELELEETQGRFERAVNAVADGIWDWDIASNQVYYSPQWKALLGYDDDELENSFEQFQKLIMPSDYSKVQKAIEDYFNERIPEYRVEFRMRHKNGKMRWILARGEVRRDEDGKPLKMYGSHTDITSFRETQENLYRLTKGLKHSNEDLENTTQYLRGILEHASDGIHILDTEGNIVEHSHSFARMLGYSTKETSRLNVADWEASIPLEKIKGTIAGLLHAPTTFETKHLRKDGTVFDAEVNVSQIILYGKEHLYASSRDITERKKLEHDLLRSNRELEQFAYVISHDLRQPLRMVNSYIQLLEKDLDDRLDDDNREMMDFITDGATRMDKMLISILDYSRVGRLSDPIEAFDSKVAVDYAVHFLSSEIEEANGQLTICGKWPRVVMAEDELTRLVQNFVSNALKFIKPDTAPRIEIKSELTPSEWFIHVTDNGIGIEPHQIDRLFKIFTRLNNREDYPGTGIGLAICKKIAERFNGSVTCYSDGLGKGATFEARFARQAVIESEVTAFLQDNASLKTDKDASS